LKGFCDYHLRLFVKNAMKLETILENQEDEEPSTVLIGNDVDAGNDDDDDDDDEIMDVAEGALQDDKNG